MEPTPLNQDDPQHHATQLLVGTQLHSVRYSTTQWQLEFDGNKVLILAPHISVLNPAITLQMRMPQNLTIRTHVTVVGANLIALTEGPKVTGVAVAPLGDMQITFDGGAEFLFPRGWYLTSPHWHHP